MICEERRVLPDARGAAGQKARLVDRCGRDRIAGGFVRRDALAGERRLVDCARAIEHHAVDRNALAGADDEGVSGLHRSMGSKVCFLAASYNRLPFWAPSFMRLLSASVVLPLDRASSILPTVMSVRIMAADSK